MNLSLKQARRAEVELGNIVEEYKHSLISDLETFQKKQTAISEGTTHINTVKERIFNALNLRQRIRDAISVANHDSGLNQKIAAIALREQELEVRESIVSRGKVKTTEQYRRGDYETVYQAGLSAEDIEDLKVYIRQTKLAIAKLKDSTAGMNNNTFIELSDEDAQHLVELGLA